MRRRGAIIYTLECGGALRRDEASPPSFCSVTHIRQDWVPTSEVRVHRWSVVGWCLPRDEASLPSFCSVTHIRFANTGLTTHIIVDPRKTERILGSLSHTHTHCHLLSHGLLCCGWQRAVFCYVFIYELIHAGSLISFPSYSDLQYILRKRKLALYRTE